MITFKKKKLLFFIAGVIFFAAPKVFSADTNVNGYLKNFLTSYAGNDSVTDKASKLKFFLWRALIKNESASINDLYDLLSLNIDENEKDKIVAKVTQDRSFLRRKLALAGLGSGYFSYRKGTDLAESYLSKNRASAAERLGDLIEKDLHSEQVLLGNLSSTRRLGSSETADITRLLNDSRIPVEGKFRDALSRSVESGKTRFTRGNPLDSVDKAREALVGDKIQKSILAPGSKLEELKFNSDDSIKPTYKDLRDTTELYADPVARDIAGNYNTRLTMAKYLGGVLALSGGLLGVYEYYLYRQRKEFENFIKSNGDDQLNQGLINFNKAMEKLKELNNNVQMILKNDLFVNDPKLRATVRWLLEGLDTKISWFGFPKKEDETRGKLLQKIVNLKKEITEQDLKNIGFVGSYQAGTPFTIEEYEKPEYQRLLINWLYNAEKAKN